MNLSSSMSDSRCGRKMCLAVVGLNLEMTVSI